MLLGSHVNYGSKGLLGATEMAIALGANTFMFYTGAPQNTVRKPIDIDIVQKAHALMQENKIEASKVICHAPYIINLANKAKIDAWNFSISFLKQEISRCETLGIKYLVLHPGSAVTHTREEAIENICDALNEVLEPEMNVMLILETMAGKGTECGKDIAELKAILSGVIYPDNLGICLDTCHLNDSGIDINKFDEYLDLFAQEIGLEKVKCIHINDSLNPIGAHKDRHANIGFGTIGYDTLIKVVYNEKLKDVPKILETPYIEDYPPYKFEIESILKKEFYPDLKERVVTFYKNL